MSTAAQAQGTNKTILTIAFVLGGGYLLVKYGAKWFGGTSAAAAGGAPGGGSTSFPDNYQPYDASQTQGISQQLLNLLGGLFAPKGGNVSIGGPNSGNPSGNGASAYDNGTPTLPGTAMGDVYANLDNSIVDYPGEGQGQVQDVSISDTIPIAPQPDTYQNERWNVQPLRGQLQRIEQRSGRVLKRQRRRRRLQRQQRRQQRLTNS